MIAQYDAFTLLIYSLCRVIYQIKATRHELSKLGRRVS